MAEPLSAKPSSEAVPLGLAGVRPSRLGRRPTLLTTVNARNGPSCNTLNSPRVLKGGPLLDAKGIAMKTLIAALAALLGATLTAPAQAEEVTISRALAAGSLHEGALDMVAYWLEVPDGALEVTATFRDRETIDEPMRIVMPMQDGDALSFGMPGYAGSLYSFARSGKELNISVETNPDRIAGMAPSIDEAKILPQPASDQ